MKFSPQRTFRELARTLLRVATTVLCAVALVASGPSLQAQDPGRKVKHRVQPEYPELARRLNIKGAVRLELQVTPEGKIKDVKVLGGSPVLVKASVEAVHQWVFEPAPQAFTTIVRFDFGD